jgi:hypothetical protein
MANQLLPATIHLFIAFSHLLITTVKLQLCNEQVAMTGLLFATTNML